MLIFFSLRFCRKKKAQLRDFPSLSFSLSLARYLFEKNNIYIIIKILYACAWNTSQETKENWKLNFSSLSFSLPFFASYNKIRFFRRIFFFVFLFFFSSIFFAFFFHFSSFVVFVVDIGGCFFFSFFFKEWLCVYEMFLFVVVVEIFFYSFNDEQKGIDVIWKG